MGTHNTAWAERVAQDLRTRHLDLSLILEPDDAGNVAISRIVLPVNERGQGLGTVLMRELIDAADAYGTQLVLDPSTEFGGDVGRLTRWYLGLGFISGTRGPLHARRTSHALRREPDPRLRVSNPDRKTGHVVESGRPHLLPDGTCVCSRPCCMATTGGRTVCVCRICTSSHDEHVISSAHPLLPPGYPWLPAAALRALEDVAWRSAYGGGTRSEREAMFRIAFTDSLERYLGFGGMALEAVVDAWKAGRTHVDLTDVPPGSPIPWPEIVADLRKSGMADFVGTMHGVLMLGQEGSS
ncbi:hypothetical protein [Streptomyces sp. TR02-1]|uniref:hypothetical protein n=1 Tax=Streptomyces sp. TR02-1 TaxID=3385977 RepID=UPI0039A0D833